MPYYYIFDINIYIYQYHDIKPNPINIDWLLGLTPTCRTLLHNVSLQSSVADQW